MISSPAREATQYAVRLAKEKGMLVSYDPNLRLGLWSSEEHARETIISMVDQADMLKVSEEELAFMTGVTDIDTGVQKLKKEFDIPLIIVTLGSEGSYVYTLNGQEHVSTLKVKAIDTTGAGDAFVSAMLYSIHEYEGDIRSLAIQEAVKMATFASISGALAASTKGAMTALPTLAEVKYHLEK